MSEYTFRTEFDLTGIRPETAILRGWLLVDNYFSAIRLNGHEVPVAKNDRPNYHDRFHPLTIAKGFIEGVSTCWRWRFITACRTGTAG